MYMRVTLGVVCSMGITVFYYLYSEAEIECTGFPQRQRPLKHLPGPIIEVMTEIRISTSFVKLFLFEPAFIFNHTSWFYLRLEVPESSKKGQLQPYGNKKFLKVHENREPYCEMSNPVAQI